MKTFNPNEPAAEVECTLCGRDGTPPPNCGTCRGGATTQPRAYTLSDHRAGRAPDENRYTDVSGLKEYNPYSPEGDIK